VNVLATLAVCASQSACALRANVFSAAFCWTLCPFPQTPNKRKAAVIKAVRMECNLSSKASPYHTDPPPLSRNPFLEEDFWVIHKIFATASGREFSYHIA